MLLFRVEIVIASSVMALGWLTKEEENPNFRPTLACSSKKLCVNVIPVIDHKILFGKRCHAYLKLQV